MTQAFDITFWGVRGTMPTPGASTLRYGGQTSCVQMQCGDRTLIFDAGSGLFTLGETLEHATELDLFLSHTHIDHILGFPFFGPAYRDHLHLRVWAGHLKPEGLRLHDVLSRLMSPPLFPLNLDFLKARIDYNDFNAGEPIHALAEYGIDIQTLALNHPDRATGYRVNYADKSACYITDIEHVRAGLDRDLTTFIKGADVLIYDSTFDDRAFERFVGWGHSTWQEAVRLADAANVQTLVLFHHDPAMTDDALDARLSELRALRPHDTIAREGLILHLAKR